MRYFDTHAHLLDERFDADREALIVSCKEAGFGYIMEACCDGAQIDGVLNLVEKEPICLGSVGVHPHSAQELNNETLDRMAQALTHPKILAIGEIGLDYHYDFAPRDIQKSCLSLQLELANETHVPVILHDREAHADMLDLLTAFKNGLSGVMHCFSGSYEMAIKCLDLGLYIGFGGALTFANAQKQRELAAKLPMERIVLETDCPYMTPVPHRGKRNDPTLMRETLAVLAKVRGREAEELAAQLWENSLALFGLAK